MDGVITALYWPTALWVEHPVLTVVPVVIFAAGV